MTTEFTNQTFDPVSYHRISDLTAHGNTKTEHTICSVTVYKEKVRLMHFISFMGQTKKIGPLPESLCRGKAETGRHQLFGGNLNRQTLPPFSTTTLYHKTSIFRSHTDKKTVSSFPADIAGLKGSFHGNRSSPEIELRCYE